MNGLGLLKISIQAENLLPWLKCNDLSNLSPYLLSMWKKWTFNQWFCEWFWLSKISIQAKNLLTWLTCNDLSSLPPPPYLLSMWIKWTFKQGFCEWCGIIKNFYSGRKPTPLVEMQWSEQPTPHISCPCGKNEPLSRYFMNGVGLLKISIQA